MLRIFVNTWGNYNENGADGGEWIELPMDEDELNEKLEAIAAAMGDDDPEWAIHDFEWPGVIDLGEVHEMDSITEWNERCQEADGLEEYELQEVMAAVEAFGYSFTEALERQQSGGFIFYPGQSLEEVAAELADEYLEGPDIPDFIRRYFDYDAFARDLGYEGYNETEHGVICDN